MDQSKFDERVDVADEYMDPLTDLVVQPAGMAEGTTQVATTRPGLGAYPLTLAEERCSMQLVTVADCFTFFFSIAVILYLWIQ